MLLRRIINEQGRWLTWVAFQIGVSGSLLSRMLDGERRWKEERIVAVVEALGLDEEQEAAVRADIERVWNLRLEMEQALRAKLRETQLHLAEEARFEQAWEEGMEG